MSTSKNKLRGVGAQIRRMGDVFSKSRRVTDIAS